MLPQKCPITKPKKCKRENLESPVVKAVLQYLVDHPRVILVERRNTGAVKFNDGSMIHFGSKGRADIWCLVKTIAASWVSLHGGTPEHVEIECKRADGKGRLSPAQKKFQAHCLACGIPYLVVTSVEELIAGLDNLGLDINP